MPASNGTELGWPSERAAPKGEQDLYKYMYLFIFPKILMDIGMAPKFVLGPTYIDENVSQRRSPKLLGQLSFF